MDLRILLATVAIVCVSGTKVWAPKPDDEQKDDVKDFKRESLYRSPPSLPSSPIPDQAHMQVQRKQEGGLSFRDFPFRGKLGLARLRLRLRQLPDLRPDRLTPLVSRLACALAQASDEGRKVFPAQIKDVKAFFLQPHELVQVSYRAAFLSASSPALDHPFLVLLKDRIAAIEAAEKKLASLSSPVAPAGETAAGAAAVGAGVGTASAGVGAGESGGTESNSSLLKTLQALRTYYEDYGTSLCKAPAEERRKRLSGIRVQGDHLESYFISEETAYQILSTDIYGVDKKTNTTGASPVACLGGMHFKRNLEKTYGDNAIVSYTLQPGLEWSMYSFSAHLFGQGIPPSMFLTVSGVPHRLARTGTPADTLFKKAGDPNTGEAERQRVEDILSRDPSLQEDLVLETRDYFVQASKTIPGKGLDEVLKTNPSLNNCDLDSFSALVLMTLLTNPADAKADNFIVTTDATGKHSLTSIDNDYALANMIAKREREGHHFLESKSILFCLRDLMKQPLGERIRKKVLTPLPHVFMLKWLKSLQIQNARYERLRQQQGISPQTFERLSLPLKFHPGVVKRVVQNFMKLQETLRTKRVCSHDDLLNALYPSVALYYQQLAQTYPNDPLEAYNAIHHGQNQAALERTLNPAYVFPDDKTAGEYLKAETAPGEAYKVRTQSVEESVLDLFHSLSLERLGHPRNLHTFLEAAIHLFPEQAYRVTERSWLESSLLVKVLPYRPSFPLAQYFLRLNPEESLKEREAYPDTRNTSLHLAVLHAPDVIPLFIERGAEPEAENKEGQTPLDLAMVHRLEPAFVQLITEGAGIKANPKYGLPFYKTLRLQTPSHAAFMTLMRRNPAVEWEVALDTILPPKPKGFFQSAGVSLQGAGIGPRTLSASLGMQLLTSQGQIIQRNHLGRHKVGMVENSDKRHKIYFKEYPELPGFEEAVGLLTRQILGFGAPHTELLRIHDRPVLASQGIHGPTLREVFENQPHLLQQLDHESLASMMLMAMLLNPEDGKPDNYILEKIPNSQDKYRLIGVDNDHAFVPGVAKEQKQKGSKPEVVTQVKTVLFCFEEMYRPVPPQTRERFLKIDAGRLLDDWLGKLGEINLAYQQLFEDFIKSGKIKDFLEIHDCYVGIPFVPDMMGRLFDKMIALQEELRSPQNLSLTPMGLLKKLEPYLGHRYDKIFKKYKSVKERFQGIDGGFYGSNGQTITKSGHVLNALDIPSKVAVVDVMRRDNGYDPNYRFLVARKELARNRKHYGNLVLFRTTGGKINIGNPETLTSEGLSKTLGYLDFRTLSPSEEESLLGVLRDRPFRSLSIRNARTLSDNWVRDNVRLTNLTSLDLRGSKGITHWFLPMLRQGAPLLQTLNLSYIEELVEFSDPGILYSTPIIFTELQSLNLEGCPKLALIRLEALHLEWLNASQCSKLTEITLTTPVLRTLQLNNTPVKNETVLASIAQKPQLKQINLEGCRNVWRGIQDWGQNLTRNYLNLRMDNIRDVGAGYVAEALKVNRGLTQLYLGYNQIGDVGAGYVAKALKVNKGLTQLYLGGNQIGNQGAGFLADALKVNRNLTQLNLELNELGERGAGHVAEALRVNKGLTQLYLGGNQIGNQGAGFLADALKVNQTLTHMGVSLNGIGFQGAGAIAKALKVNRALSQVDLKWNYIGDQGAGALAEALKVNQTLTQVDLGGNAIGDQGAGALTEALKVNQILTDLNLNNNDFGRSKAFIHQDTEYNYIRERVFSLIKNFLAQNREMLNGWIQYLSEPLENALLGCAPGSGVLTERGHQSRSLPLVTQGTSPGTAQSQFSRETLHLILSYIPPSNLKEWFEQTQKAGPLKETRKDSQKDYERDDEKDRKDDKKDSGKDSKKDEKKDDRPDRKLAPLEGSQMQRAASNQPLMTAGGEPLYEFLISGENSGCAVYCLGFPHHTAARNALLAKSADPLIRGLIVPEIRADLAANGKASRFIATSEIYKKFQRDEESATVALNAETQRLTQKLKLAKTATREQLEKALPPEDLQTYRRLAEAKAKTDEAFKSYLSSEDVFKRFVSESLRDGIMQTYIPGREASSLLDALSRIQGYNLRVMGKTHEGRLAVLHEYVWDGTKSTHLLLHTKYQDAEGRPIVGGTPGTVLQNNWNHFNLLSPDTAMTVERIGFAKPSNSEVFDRDKDKPFPKVVTAPSHAPFFQIESSNVAVITANQPPAGARASTGGPAANPMSDPRLFSPGSHAAAGAGPGTMVASTAGARAGWGSAPAQDTIFVLSLDGGGIRDVIPATILRHIETEVGLHVQAASREQMEKILGKPLKNKDLSPTVHLARGFHLMAGTSTGGIIALGLTVPDPKHPSRPKYQTKTLVDLYEKQGPVIFPAYFGRSLSHLTGQKFEAAPLEKVLMEHFGEARLSQSVGPVLITGYDTHQECSRSFESNEARKSPKAKDFLTRHVARATSAAPTFLTPAEITSVRGDKYTFADGGLIANNPTMVAYLRAQETFPQARRLVMLSLGTGTAPQDNLSGLKSSGKLGWTSHIAPVIFERGSELVHDLLLAQSRVTGSSLHYVRVQPVLPRARTEMDKVDPDNIQYLTAHARKYVAQSKDLAVFIAEFAQSYARRKDLFFETSLIADQLRGNPRVLKLEGQQIHDAGAWEIGQYLSQAAPGLTELHLGSNQITSQGLRLLAHGIGGLPSLTSLNLQANGITSQDLEGLPTLRALRVLNVDNNAFGPSGMAYLAPAAMSLTDLSLVGNEISDAGAAILLQHLPTLTSLNVARNSITDKGARTLMALPHLRTLSLHRNKGVAAGVVPGLQGNTTLTQLDLSHTGMDDGQLGAFVASLRQNTTLVSLNLAVNMITATGAHHLAGLLEGPTPLTELDVSNNNLQSVGARWVLDGLARNRFLTTLFLDRNQIEDNAPQPKAGDHKGKEKDNPLQDGLVRMIGQNKTLRTLSLTGNSLSEPFQTMIGQLLPQSPQLKVVFLKVEDIYQDAVRHTLSGDPTKGLEGLAKVLKVDKSHAKAQHMVGFIFEFHSGGSKVSFEDALTWYTAAKNNGYAEAENDIARVNKKISTPTVSSDFAATGNPKDV